MKILVLTDHQKHSDQNSVYGLVYALRQREPEARFYIASRAVGANSDFFYHFNSRELQVSEAQNGFYFNEAEKFFTQGAKKMKLEEFDWILLRLPRPIPTGFFDFLRTEFSEQHIINRPTGIERTSNKLFLLNYPQWCPPMKHCRSVEDILNFAEQFPIVLKPLESYGGQGLIRIEEERVWEEQKTIDRDAFIQRLQRTESVDYLAMKYLKNVNMGDKRILVSNENILGATLRKPPPGSWLCNVSQGGTSHEVEPDEREIEILNDLVPDMRSLGVILFGIDTLVGDDGLRYLSEINTLSLGGLTPADRASGKPILDKAAEGIWNYINKKS